MIKDLRDEVVNIKSAFATIDLDAIKNEITELSATVTGVRADIMKPEMFETIPTFVNIKSELTRLNLTVSDHGSQIQQLMNGAGAGSSSTPLVGSQADFAATIASAVAVATRKPDGESEGWAGVACTAQPTDGRGQPRVYRADPARTAARPEKGDRALADCWTGAPCPGRFALGRC